MKILLLDPLGCRPYNIGYQMKLTLQNIGHDVVTFNYRKWHLQHISVMNRLMNKMMVRAAQRIRADLVLVSKGEALLPGTISSIKKAGIATAMWCTDEPFGELMPFNKLSNIGEYDAFFCYGDNYIDRIRQYNPNTYLLPAAAEVTLVHREQIPLEKREFPYDINLVGTAYPNRVNLLSQITNHKLLIAGPGWQGAPEHLRSIARPAVSEQQMVRLFNQAKIVLNPYGASPLFLFPNPRTFEIPASRSFQMTDKNVRNYFTPGKEVVTYNDMQEFRELVEYYLDRDEERLKITQAGYERVMKEHTMKHRMENLLQILKKIDII